MRPLLFFLLLAEAVQAIGCSQAHEEHVARATAPLESTTIAASTPYSVGVCVGGDPTQCDFKCTGTLIAPNLVLGVRHCFYQTPRNVDCSKDTFGPTQGALTDYFITTSTTVSTPNAPFHRVRQAFVPPSSTLCGADIVALLLEDNVPSTEAVPIVPSVDVPLTDHTRMSGNVTVLGYGETRPNAGDYGTRRVLGPVSITCIPGDPTSTCGPDVQGFATTDEFVISGGGCDGDSGLGAIDQASFDRNSPLVVGVLARGNVTDVTCFRNVLVRVDRWANLLIRAAQLAAAFGNYGVPAWAAQVHKGALGDDCGAPDDCASGLCETLDGGLHYLCAQSCDPTVTTSCPSNYTCKALPSATSSPENRCVVAPPPPTPTPVPPPPPKSSGCAVAETGDSSPAAPWALVFGAAVAVACARRRRCARCATSCRHVCLVCKRRSHERSRKPLDP